MNKLNFAVFQWHSRL